MKDDSQHNPERRALLGNFGVAAVAGIATAAASSKTQAQQDGGFTPQRHAADAWMDQQTGSHRVFIDSSTTAGGSNAVRYANNILFTHTQDYDGADSDYALIVCFRHASTPFGFGDTAWEKYGAVLSLGANPEAKANPMNSPSMANGQNTLADLGARGVRFAVCSKATQVYARRIASATGQESEQIHAELVASLVPNARFVPAGVIAATRAQEYRYSLLYAE